MLGLRNMEHKDWLKLLKLSVLLLTRIRDNFTTLFKMMWGKYSLNLTNFKLDLDSLWIYLELPFPQNSWFLYLFLNSYIDWIFNDCSTRVHKFILKKLDFTRLNTQKYSFYFRVVTGGTVFQEMKLMLQAWIILRTG